MTTPHASLGFEGTPDLWETLAAERRDIYLYGMGNGADKILSVLAARHIPVTGVFASDGFVRGHSFHGMPVRSFSDICAQYPQNGCVVLLAFGSARPEVLALFDAVAARYPLLVPDVPVAGTALFDRAFFEAHRDAFYAARTLLADDESRRIFDLVLTAKYTGAYAALQAAVSPDDTAKLLRLAEVHTAVDLGAYSGDSARALMQHAPLAHLICAEPDRRSFKKLSEWAKTVPFPVECHHAAVDAADGVALFGAAGNRGAGLVCEGLPTSVTAKTDEIPVVSPDSLLAESNVDYIKYDIEGAEYAALRGTRETIARCHPRLKISCYHRSEDLFALPLLLSELAPGYRLYLRRTAGVPAWDIDLIAVPPARYGI